MGKITIQGNPSDDQIRIHRIKSGYLHYEHKSYEWGQETKAEMKKVALSPGDTIHVQTGNANIGDLFTVEKNVDLRKYHLIVEGSPLSDKFIFRPGSKLGSNVTIHTRGGKYDKVVLYEGIQGKPILDPEGDDGGYQSILTNPDQRGHANAAFTPPQTRRNETFSIFMGGISPHGEPHVRPYEPYGEIVKETGGYQMYRPDQDLDRDPTALYTLPRYKWGEKGKISSRISQQSVLSLNVYPEQILVDRLAYAGDFQAIRLLILDEGGDPNWEGDHYPQLFSGPPLPYAALSGHLDIVALLTDYGANLYGQSKASGAQALHFSAWANQLDTVKYLLDQGADVSSRDFAGNQPFTYCRQDGELRDVLISKMNYDAKAKANGKPIKRAPIILTYEEQRQIAKREYVDLERSVQGKYERTERRAKSRLASLEQSVEQKGQAWLQRGRRAPRRGITEKEFKKMQKAYEDEYNQILANYERDKKRIIADFEEEKESLAKELKDAENRYLAIGKKKG